MTAKAQTVATGITLKRTQTRISARRAQAKESKVLEIPNMAPLLRRGRTKVIKCPVLASRIIGKHSAAVAAPAEVKGGIMH